MRFFLKKHHYFYENKTNNKIKLNHINHYKELVPNGTWTAAGIGRHQFEVAQWCLELGGHCRTGLEDNIKFDRSRLASSNAELVTKLTDIMANHNRHPASPAEARAILNL